MEDVIPSENDGEVANRLNDNAWGPEEIVDPADELSRTMSEALDAFGMKGRSAGNTFLETPAEIIALALEGLCVHARPSTA